MKKLGSWVLGITAAVLSAVLGCGRRHATDDPSPPPEIHWRGVETGYRATTEPDAASESRQPAPH